MNDYIVGKKYRLLQSHPESSWQKTDFKENETLIYKGLSFCENLTFKRSNGKKISILTCDGYPKMEPVEEE